MPDYGFLRLDALKMIRNKRSQIRRLKSFRENKKKLFRKESQQNYLEVMDGLQVDTVIKDFEDNDKAQPALTAKMEMQQHIND